MIYSKAMWNFGGLSAEEVVQDSFYCSIYIWYNFKALVPLTNKFAKGKKRQKRQRKVHVTEFV